uniref:FYVE-type domain-containing protein n=1 Tax=Noctiluca scintillans TaxID=2966 RepID=A0A7S1B102_NOCSC
MAREAGISNQVSFGQNSINAHSINVISRAGSARGIREGRQEGVCSKCSAQIGKRYFLRRHHCRVCHRAFCGKCCRSRIPLAGQPGLHRACVECSRVSAEKEPILVRLCDLAERIRSIPGIPKSDNAMDISMTTIGTVEALELCERALKPIEDFHAAAEAAGNQRERSVRDDREREAQSKKLFKGDPDMAETETEALEVPDIPRVSRDVFTGVRRGRSHAPRPWGLCGRPLASNGFTRCPTHKEDFHSCDSEEF